MSDLLKEDIKGDELLKSLSMYYTSRIDIKNSGTNDNTVEIIENSDTSAKIQYPNWLKNEKGKGMMIQSDNLSIDLKIKCIKNGTLNITLRGLDEKDKEENRFPAYIDYTSLKINNKEHLTENKLICHDEPLIIRRKVKDNELVTLHVEWKPFTSSSLYENKKEKKLERKIEKLNEKIEALQKEETQRIEELKEENTNLKRKLSLISNSSLLEIKKIKKEL